MSIAELIASLLTNTMTSFGGRRGHRVREYDAPGEWSALHVRVALTPFVFSYIHTLHLHVFLSNRIRGAACDGQTSCR